MLRQSLSHTIFALLAIGSFGTSVLGSQPRFTILNTTSGIFLQMDVDSLPGDVEPRIDTLILNLQDKVDTVDGIRMVKAKPRVTWSTIPLTVASEAKITDAQIMKRIEIPLLSSCPTCKDTLRAIHVDTIEFGTTATGAIHKQTYTPDINEYTLTPRKWCSYERTIPFCGRLGVDSACWLEVIDRFIFQWRNKRNALILDPDPIGAKPYFSPWTLTDGTESYQGIAGIDPHNAGNWIEVSRVRFTTRRILKQSPPPGPPPATPILPIWEMPNGTANYVYNRTASPELDTIETGDHRVYGNLLKIGETLRISQVGRPQGCLRPLVDTTMGNNPWLVLTDTLLEFATQWAMSPTYYPIGPGRVSAWQLLPGDTVKLDNSHRIPLDQLLARAEKATRVSDVASTPSFRLERTASGISIELRDGGSTRIVSPGGRILSAWTTLPAGRHALAVPRGGISFVQVRTGGSVATLPLVR